MVLKVFEKLDADVDPKNVEGCHWLKTRNNSIRCSSVNKIIKNKRCGQNASSLKLKKIKSMNLASMGDK